METLDVILGAAIAGLAWLAGRSTHRRPKETGDPKPVCGCGHHRSFHEPTDDPAIAGRCHHERSSMGDIVYCRCKQYSGPEPLPTYFG